MTNPRRLQAREQAAQAFNRSWRKETLVPVGIFCLLALVGLGFSAQFDSIAFAVVGALGALLSGWVGGSTARVAVPALLAGSIPLACGLGAASLGHVCIGSSCASLCVPACVTGGGVAGILVGRLLARTATPIATKLSASLLTCSLGALGCCCVGYAGVVGMGLGFSAASAFSLWRGSRKSVCPSH
jgi:hypothetical protein